MTESSATTPARRASGPAMKAMPILLALSTLPGCFLINSGGGDPGGDDDDTRARPRKITINWSVKNVDGSPATCPPGFGGLLVRVTEANLGAQENDVISCATSGTFSRDIFTEGDYYFYEPDDLNRYHFGPYTQNQLVDLYITDPTGENQFVKSHTIPVTLDTDKTVDVEIYPNGGFAVMHWELQSAATGAFASCAAVEIDEIAYRYRPFDQPDAPLVTDRWPCTHTEPLYPYLGSLEVGNGMTRPLPLDSYVGTLVALRGGVEVSSTEDVQMTVPRGQRDNNGNLGPNVTEAGGDMIVIVDR